MILIIIDIMDSHIQKKINNYCTELRSLFLKELDALEEKINGSQDNGDIINILNELKMKYTFLPFPKVKKEDFMRKKRIQNKVSENDQCVALCSGGVRCSRRRQNKISFCGTHVKGQPNGTLTDDLTTIDEKRKDVQYVYPVNENGIIKIYKDELRTSLMNANDFMKVGNS